VISCGEAVVIGLLIGAIGGKPLLDEIDRLAALPLRVWSRLWGR